MTATLVLTSDTLEGNTQLGEGAAGGYVFNTWKGDHSPRHVHVYRDGVLVVKWDLDNAQPMIGKASRRVRALIEALETEGAL